MKTGTGVGARGRCATHEGECRVAGARETQPVTLRAGGERGDLRIRRKKKEQGREAGRYYEQCANRVRGFSPRPSSVLPPGASPFLATFSSLFRLLLIFVYYSMETGRCSLIDGTGHGRAAARKKERKKEEKRGKRAEEEESEGEESKRTTCGERRRRRRAAAAGPPSPYL